MIRKKHNPNPVIGKFLTEEEREVCKRISQLDAGLACRRAALLALDEGLTSAEASVRASLTIGQMKYLRSAFAKKHLMVFPRDMLLKLKSVVKAKDKTQKGEKKKVKTKAKKKNSGKKKGEAKKKNKAQKQNKKKQNKKKQDKKNKKDKKVKKNKSRKAKSTKK